MKYINGKAVDVKIAYIGGGSRGWAWKLMSDLAACTDMCGSVYLYDIDYEAAKNNETIGNMFSLVEGCNAEWKYFASRTPREVLTGADFVIISILPGTFDEMESDVHAPEKYGIYQSVGDTTGPGGIVRAMRTVPMLEQIAEYIKEYSPEAWVINYTNPMTLCIKTLYRVFPKIKAFGCCHEVFGTQEFLAEMIAEEFGERPKREEIKVNPVAVNHFTWLTSASYKNIDLFPYYGRFCDKYKDGYVNDEIKRGLAGKGGSFVSKNTVKMELFKRYGYIAAAGDRHLVEFLPGKWYLESPERVKEMGFGLTPVSYRKEDLKDRLSRSERLRSGEEKLKLEYTGEEGINQMRAILGLTELCTNVNIPNRGQIPNLPMGAVVETNAMFRSGSVTPLFAGPIPESIYPLVSRISQGQENLSAAIAARDLDEIFACFINDPLVTCSMKEAKELFEEMIENTKEYLKSYNV